MTRNGKKWQEMTRNYKKWTRNGKKSQQGVSRQESSSGTFTKVAMFLKCGKNRTVADIILTNRTVADNMLTYRTVADKY